MMDEKILYSLMMGAVLFLLWTIWFGYQRYRWFADVIKKNPESLILRPVITKKMVDENRGHLGKEAGEKVLAPNCNFKQYLKYLWLACLPYAWSVPIKYLILCFKRQFKSKLSDDEKRQRLAKMVLETSLVLGFDKKSDNMTYNFKYERFRMPTKKCNKKGFDYFEECKVVVVLRNDNTTIVQDIILDDTTLLDINEMFSFLNTLWCVYTHTLTHVQAGNVSEINKEMAGFNDETGLKASIDDMHSAASGMNESANHYPADIWGIPRLHLQTILGYNGVQSIGNHQNIFQCLAISKFIAFCMKARPIFKKHLDEYKINISTLSANTIFHSLDHYNMGRFFLQDSEKKEFLGIESRTITAILGDLNYDFGRWQGMQYTKYKIWRSIYQELKEIDAHLASKVHMFISV